MLPYLDFSSALMASELFQKSRKLLTFERDQIRQFSLLSSIDLLENLMVYETENSRTIGRDFSIYVLKVAHDLGIRRFCKMLLSLIFKQRSVVQLEYQRLISQHFQGSVRQPGDHPTQDQLGYTQTSRSGQPPTTKSFHEVVLKYLIVFERFNPSVFDLVFESRSLSNFVVVKLDQDAVRRLFESPNPADRSYRPGYFLELLHRHFADVFQLPVLSQSLDEGVIQQLHKVQRIN